MNRHTTLLTTIALTMMLVAACGDVSFVADDQGPQAIDVGNKAFSAEMYDTAMNAYEIAQESMPDRSEPMYNTANTLYREERFREAVEMYDQILAGSDLELSDWTTFNAGNALYGSGEHEQAIEMYKQALRNNPDDIDAKYNLELALAHLPQPPEPEQAPESSQEQPTPEPQPQQEQQPNDQSDQQNEGQQQSDQQNEGEPQESETEGEGEPQEGESEPQGDPTEPGTGDQPLEEIVPPSGLTEEQARLLLEMVGESAEPLRNAIQDRRRFSGIPPAQEW